MSLLYSMIWAQRWWNADRCRSGNEPDWNRVVVMWQLVMLRFSFSESPKYASANWVRRRNLYFKCWVLLPPKKKSSKLLRVWNIISLREMIYNCWGLHILWVLPVSSERWQKNQRVESSPPVEVGLGAVGCGDNRSIFLVVQQTRDFPCHDDPWCLFWWVNMVLICFYMFWWFQDMKRPWLSFWNICCIFTGIHRFSFGT